MSETIEREPEAEPPGDATGQDAESCEQAPESDRRRRRRLTAVWCAVACLLIGYMVVLPVVQTIIEATKPVVSGRVLEDMSVAENVRLRSAEIFGVVWFFAVGASFGSFLNVVAYRLPRGKSIGGSSHCPHCSVRITRRDNVPILGWLLLGGRCRTCRQPISPRYLFVEALAGGLFVLFLFVELLPGGANLPFVREHCYNGFVWIVFYPKWDILGIYAYHMAMLCFLLVLALIEWDRLRVSKRLVLVGILVGFLSAAVWPTLHPVAWWMPRPDWLASWPWLARFDTSLLGLAAGACIGTALSIAAEPRDSANLPRCVPASATAAMALAGLFLGWQAAVSIGCFTAVFRSFASMAGRLGPPFANPEVSGWILASTVLQLSLWRTLSGWSLWPGPNASPLVVCVGCLGVVVASLLARRLSRPVYACRKCSS